MSYGRLTFCFSGLKGFGQSVWKLLWYGTKLLDEGRTLHCAVSPNAPTQWGSRPKYSLCSPRFSIFHHAQFKNTSNTSYSSRLSPKFQSCLITTRLWFICTWGLAFLPGWHSTDRVVNECVLARRPITKPWRWWISMHFTYISKYRLNTLNLKTPNPKCSNNQLFECWSNAHRPLDFKALWVRALGIIAWCPTEEAYANILKSPNSPVSNTLGPHVLGKGC